MREQQARRRSKTERVRFEIAQQVLEPEGTSDRG